MSNTRDIMPPSNFGPGKLPPQSTDAEESLLGDMLNHESSLFNVIDFMKPEYFYSTAHQKIFNAIKLLFEKHEMVDEMTVIIKLRSLGELEVVGGAYAITELTRYTRVNWDFNSKIIFQKYLAREAIRISVETIHDAYEDTTDVFEMVTKNQSEMLNLTHNKTAKQSRKMNDLIASCRTEYAIPVVNGITGIATGLTEVDKITHGWQNSDLTIIAARPSMGKTAFVLHAVKHAAVDLDKPVVVFSLEMSDTQLTSRMIASVTDTHVEKLLTHNLTEEDNDRIDKLIGPLNDATIIIDDTAGLNIFEFRAKCRRLKAQHDIQLIVVDYLQLMSGKIDGKGNNGNREQEIGSISRALKSVAKELNVPVIALSQLSRAVESRPGGSKRPMLSDLRESGSIEQDADMVLFLYRDEYYGIREDKSNNSTIGKCEVIVAKNRNGKLDTAVTDFNGAKMRFKDWDYGSNINGLLGNATTQKSINQSKLPFNNVPANNEDDEVPF